MPDSWRDFKGGVAHACRRVCQCMCLFDITTDKIYNKVKRAHATAKGPCAQLVDNLAFKQSPYAHRYPVAEVQYIIWVPPQGHV